MCDSAQLEEAASGPPVHNAQERQADYPLSPGEWAAVAAGVPLPILVSTEQLLIGIKAFDPGEEFPNHFHSTTTETFIGGDGKVELWLDRSERVVLTSGVTRSVPPGREHYLRNVSGMPAVILYIKAPHRARDLVVIGWVPDDDSTESVEREPDP